METRYDSKAGAVQLLYEMDKISFQEYLNFFSYLSSYRFRFLPIAIEDLEASIWEGETVKIINVENLKKFNFPLTLSEEYGVPFRTAATLMVHFLVKLLIDDSITPEIMEKIFSEIITTFPTEKDKQNFGRSLIAASGQVINRSRGRLILVTRIQEKIDTLSRFIEGYSSHGGIIIPFS